MTMIVVDGRRLREQAGVEPAVDRNIEPASDEPEHRERNRGRDGEENAVQVIASIHAFASILTVA